MALTATLHGTLGRSSTSFERTAVAKIGTASGASLYDSYFRTEVRYRSLDGSPDTAVPITVPLGTVVIATALYIRVVNQARIQISTETAVKPFIDEDTLANTDGTTGPFGFTLSNVPVVPGSVAISLPDDTGSPQVVTDSGGGFTGGQVTGGSINYTTGVVTGLVFSAAPLIGEDILVSYSQDRIPQTQELDLGTEEHPEGLYLWFGNQKVTDIKILEVFADRTEVQVWVAGNGE